MKIESQLIRVQNSYTTNTKGKQGELRKRIKPTIKYSAIVNLTQFFTYFGSWNSKDYTFKSYENSLFLTIKLYAKQMAYAKIHSRTSDRQAKTIQKVVCKYAFVYCSYLGLQWSYR